MAGDGWRAAHAGAGEGGGEAGDDGGDEGEHGGKLGWGRREKELFGDVRKEEGVVCVCVCVGAGERKRRSGRNKSLSMGHRSWLGYQGYHTG